MLLVCQRYGPRARVYVYHKQDRSVETSVGYTSVRLGCGDPQWLAATQRAADQVTEHRAVGGAACFGGGQPLVFPRIMHHAAHFRLTHCVLRVACSVTQHATRNPEHVSRTPLCHPFSCRQYTPVPFAGKSFGRVIETLTAAGML